MIEYNFEKSISFWVGMTSHLFETALNNELADTGITLRQVQVLASLALHGELSQTELAGTLRIEPSTMVRILDRMERNNWIERDDASNDRRKKIIRPTERVTARWATIIKRGEAMEQRAIAGLNEKQLLELKNTLTVIRKNLGSDF